MPVGQDNPLPVRAIAFAVCDTGIGIPADKQQLIFQAFQQADGSISRKYGGTGLGLSISLQLARAMQGDIRMSSLEGEGSVFTLYLPLEYAAEQISVENKKAVVTGTAAVPLPVPREESALFAASLPDDRGRLTQGDKSILIIEDDLVFAGILQEMIRKRGFSVLVAANGESGVALADRFIPSAVVLDVMLPNIDGWRVMSSLKDNPRTRHIPVHFITCKEDRQKALSMGAIGFATKPVSVEQLNGVLQTIEGSIAKSVKQLLIVEDKAVEAKSLVALLEEDGVEITVAASGDEAIALLSSGSFDCMVLDLGLPDMSGLGLLERIAGMESMRRIPVIVHSGRELSHEDERKLRRYTESIIIKGARSPERLLNEVALFLHLVESNLDPDKQRMIRTAIDKEAMLEGRKVLLVDDDMRNVFSLSSILAEKNMQVIEAENGLEAIAKLNEHPDVAVVLMDIMMPQMDGYTAMRAIRKDPRFATTPIIAMTAKAMKGDHEKCIEAGASDYIAKPIEMEKLFSLIRVWTFKAGNFALAEE
jgi:CheY-like chemotaxis protein